MILNKLLHLPKENVTFVFRILLYLDPVYMYPWIQASQCVVKLLSMISSSTLLEATVLLLCMC